MNPSVRLVGNAEGFSATVTDGLRHACFSIVEDAGASPPDLLLNIAATVDCAIAAATGFAAAPALDGRDRLIISIWPIAALGDWEASRAASAMTAFTRHAALAWAPARIRVNAVTIATRDRGVGQEGGWADVAALVSAMWRWRSMTGQIIGLTS